MKGVSEMTTFLGFTTGLFMGIALVLFMWIAGSVLSESETTNESKSES